MKLGVLHYERFTIRFLNENVWLDFHSNIFFYRQKYKKKLLSETYEMNHNEQKARI